MKQADTIPNVITYIGYMKFANKEEKLNWLKATGKKIRQMEAERNAAIMGQEFGRAYNLLRAMDFAKAEFKKISRSLKP